MVPEFLLPPSQDELTPANIERDRIEALGSALDAAFETALAPLSDEPISVWAQDKLFLPAGLSSMPGQLRLFPYQVGVIDAVSEPGVNEIVIEKGSRTGYNQMMAVWQLHGLATTRYPIYSIHPTEKSSRAYEEKYIRSMIEASPVLKAIIPDQDKQRWNAKTTLTGSSITFKEAGKAANFAEYSAQAIFGDEIDRPQWADGGEDVSEGDKIDLMEVRTQSFKPIGKDMMFTGSSPGSDRTSRIHPRFLLTDQRRYFMPCPHCDEEQYFQWGGRDHAHGVKWPKDNPQDAYYVCEHNGCVITEDERQTMIANGKWKSTAKGLPGKIGFHISGLLSPFMTLADLAGQFEKATRMARLGRTGSLQTFINTKLGEVWIEPEAKQSADVNELLIRRENYEAEVPSDCLFVLAAGDMQRGPDGGIGYHEISFYGVAPGERFFLIGHFIVKEFGLGDDRHFKQVADLLSRKWKRADGREMEAVAVCLDTGGNEIGGQKTVDLCNEAARRGKKWWPIKGYSNVRGERRAPLWPTSISKYKAGGHIYVIDTYLAKDAMYDRLKLEPGEPNAIHFPSSYLEGSVPIDSVFFKRLTKEKPRIVPGQDNSSWAKQPKDQEPWDCLIYAYAALNGLYSMTGGSKIRAALDVNVMPMIKRKPPEPEAEEKKIAEKQEEVKESAAPWKGGKNTAQERPAAKPKAKRAFSMVRSSFMSR